MSIPKGYKHKRVGQASKCAPQSFRRKVTPNGHFLTVCCPKGAWQKHKRHCAKGMIAVGIDMKKRPMPKKRRA